MSYAVGALEREGREGWDPFSGFRAFCVYARGVTWKNPPNCPYCPGRCCFSAESDVCAGTVHERYSTCGVKKTRSDAQFRAISTVQLVDIARAPSAKSALVRQKPESIGFFCAPNSYAGVFAS